jgi:hypothetical protein
MVLKILPNDGFETWAFVLSSSLEPNGQYPSLMPSFNQLLAKAVLFDPLAHETTNFLTCVIQQTITKVVGFGYVSSKELQAITDFLSSAVHLVPGAVARDDFARDNFCCRSSRTRSISTSTTSSAGRVS